MKEKKVIWITFNAFIDTDVYVVRELAKYYSIAWYILLSGKDNLEYANEIADLKKETDIEIQVLQCGTRLRSVKCIAFYKSLLNSINAMNPSVIYTSMAGAPYFIPVLRKKGDRNKIVLAIHNVHVPKGGNAYWFFKFYNKLAIRSFDFFHVFSKNQYDLLSAKAPGKKIWFTPFILKDYGAAKNKRLDSSLTFLNFGNIRDYKRIDVLIEAAQRAYEKTGIRFRVIIAGSCDDWSKYASLIRYPELFDLRIHRIENSDIPDLFEQADYFVAPYQDIAQSGSSIVAVNYGVPLIASRLPSFMEYVDDTITGYLIEPAGVDSLETVIERILLTGNSGHREMIDRLNRKKKEIFSIMPVVKKYREFLDEIIKQTSHS